MQLRPVSLGWSGGRSGGAISIPVTAQATPDVIVGPRGLPALTWCKCCTCPSPQFPG